MPSFQHRNDGSQLSSSDVKELKALVKGTVVLKNEASNGDYHAAINRWNEMSNKPANIVVYVWDEQDIVECVKFVKKHNIDVAVAGGRHSYHGASSSFGMVIDLGNMRQVSLDKAARTVTAQGGCIARDIELPCDAAGVCATFGNINETGVGGLTLGGGVGFLTGTYGTTADNVVSARMVLASGDVVRVSEQENSDLFWAIRGGGPNFGIVTQFTYRVHDIGDVFTEMLFFSPEKLLDCVSLINEIHQTSLEDGRFGVTLAYLILPGTDTFMAAFRVFYNGPEDRARELAAPIYRLGPSFTAGGMCRFPETTQTPAHVKYPGFDRYAVSTAHLDYPVDVSLVLDVFKRFQAVVEKYPTHLKPAKCILDMRSYKKVASVPMDAMAYSGRYDTAWMIPELQWDDAELDATMRHEVTGLTRYIRECMEKRVNASTDRDIAAIYPNLSAGGEEKSKKVFGPNMPRLQKLKSKYDPDFMWDKWFPIVPASNGA